MGWLLLLFGTFIALLKKGASAVVNPTPATATPVPPATKIGEEIAKLDWTDPAAIMDVAQRAQEAGLVESAKALATTAQDTADVKSAVDAAKGPVTSPIEGVHDVQWSAFVNLYKGGRTDEISPTFHLGMFNVGFIRLRELGFAEDVKQGIHEGRTVWKGKLKIKNLTLRDFLANAPLQYAVFVRDMKDRAGFIRKTFGSYIGKQFPDMPGIRITLSGLLAAAKLAGTKGFQGWMTDPAQRKKHARTTEAFKSANGLF